MDGVLLTTGGTGSFGHTVLKRFLDSGVEEIRIFSRDEKKQDEMRKRYASPKLKFYIGDVQDLRSLGAVGSRGRLLLPCRGTEGGAVVRVPPHGGGPHQCPRHGERSHFGRRVRQCYSVHSPVYMEKRAEARGERWMQRLCLQATGCVLHRVENRCVEEAHTVTADSDYTRALIGSVYGPKLEAKTVVVPGWVDMRRFAIVADRAASKSALGWPTDVPVLFTLRRFVPRMGLDRFLRALKLVQEAGFRFYAVIAGEGRLREGLEGLMRELGLAERVSFPGRIPDALLPTMYAAADAFVLPTVELECFGLIALESLACGRPVLATPIGAIPEVVGRFEPRWLARDATADSLAQHLIRFLDGQLPGHEPQALRATVERWYSRETVLKRLVQVAFGE